DERCRALAERLAADERGATALLQCAGDDLCGAGRAIIDEHGERLVEGCTSSCGVEDALGAARALLVQHDAAVQELAGHFDGGINQPAAVVAEVQYVSIDILLSELFDGLLDLLRRTGCKPR